MKSKVIEFIKDLGNGGAEKIVTDTCLFLDKNKFEPIVVVLFDLPEKPNSKKLRANGVKVIPIYRKANKLTYFFNEIIGKRVYVQSKFKKIIRQEKPSVIHTHMLLLPFLDDIISELKGIRLFYTCHGAVDRYFFGKHEANAIAAQDLIKKCQMRLIGLNKEMVEILNKRFNVDNTFFIRNAVDFNRFCLSESKSSLRAELGIKESDFVVGHVGRFSSVKNHSFLIDVFEKVHEKNINARLLLVGNGETFDEIRKKVAELGLNDFVIFAGQRTDIPRLLACMDVFCFPSKTEGLSVALVEAQVMGLRIVMSNRFSTDVVLSDRVYILRLEDPVQKWAEAVLNNESNILPQGVLSDWDMNKEIKRVEALYSGQL